MAATCRTRSNSSFEFAGGVRLIYDATLANSFDSDYETYYGMDAAVMLRDNKAWMFKEVDSPLLGWEVYARKDAFYKETGIALVAGGSKQTALEDKPVEEAAPFPPLYYALQSFLGNCPETAAAVEDFSATYDRKTRQVWPNISRPSSSGRRPATRTAMRPPCSPSKPMKPSSRAKGIAIKPECYELA